MTHDPTSKETLCRVRGLSILIRVSDAIERFRADTYADKEPETLEWIDRHFRPGDVLYDVGANIGLYSLYAAKRLKGDCTILAFEPEALNYAQLVRNICNNELSGRILPYCLAITDRLRLSSFHINSDSFDQISEGRVVPGSSGHSFETPHDFLGRTFQPSMSQGMLGVSLDMLCFELGAPMPNHVKIDVDGIEDSIITGMRTVLADQRLRSVLVEVSPRPGQTEFIRKALEDAGLREDADYPDHSRAKLVGSPWEGCENIIYVRPGTAERTR